MATQTVEFRAASGATLTAKLFSVGSDTVVQTASAVTEATNRKGTYAATFTDPGAAEFELIAYSGAVPVCRWFVTLTLTTATFQAYEVRTQAVVSPVTVGTNNDKTGYSLTQAFPANFSALGINSSGHVSRVTLVDTTTTNTDMRGTDNAALASNWTATRAGYLDSVLLAANSNRTVQVTGSSHVAAVVHDVEPAAIPEDAFVDNAISARAIATDAVNEIQNGLARADALATLTGYVDTEVAAIKTITDRIGTGLVADGAVWQFTANMLELAPAGGGGGTGDASQATLLEVQDTVESIAASLSGVPITASGRIADGGTITLYCGDDLRVRSGSEITITVSDVGGAIFTRLDGIGTANLSWGASRQGLPASAISGSIASLSQSGSGASQTMTIVVEIDNAGSSLKPAEDYKWQIESQQDHGAETDSVVEMEGLLSLRRRVV